MTALDRALSWFVESPAGATAADDRPAPAARPGRIGCAAVLGRPGQAEPVAAALALALSPGAHARSATVAVIGRLHAAAPGGDGRPPAAMLGRTNAAAAAGDAPAPPPAGGGTRAARRLAARLDAHGLPARPRGRLAWVAVPPDGRLPAARRIALVGAPAVLAVTAPRSLDIEELLAEQDLLLLAMADPGGPLARMAALAPGGVPVVVTRPLARGPARSLAMAGLRAPRTVRELAAAAAIPGATPREAA